MIIIKAYAIIVLLYGIEFITNNNFVKGENDIILFLMNELKLLQLISRICNIIK